MNINAGDIFLEVIGVPQISHIQSLAGVRCAAVYQQARLGDATLHLSLESNDDFDRVRHGLEASGLRLLAIKRAAH